MYSPDKYIYIDPFKDYGLYEHLSQYNKDIEEVCSHFKFPARESSIWYDITKGEASFWFDPKCVRETWTPRSYPSADNVQKDPRFNLLFNAGNYPALLVINVLFQNRKDVLIEDICSGMGHLFFYLSKLGFHNFAAFDDFSQLPKELFERMMQAGNIKYTLNELDNKPIVSNIVAYTKFPKKRDGKEIIADSLELFMTYYPLNPGNNSLHIDNDRFFDKFTPLFKDHNSLLYGYCDNNKYDEFRTKLKCIEC